MRYLINIAVMTAAMMQVLDTTIVNVALSYMEGSLAATADEVTWVLTSYLVSSAIFMPLTGYFADRFGRKKYLLISIFGFVVASIFCGLSENITQMVLFRLLQGAFGAALVPLSQAIMVDNYTEKERAKAMAIWGFGVMVGPILGPSLGGYLSDIASWRWNFYINVPVGLACMLLTWRVLPETPKKERPIDWVGLILISIGIASAQYLFDRGSQADWFEATDICIAFGLMIFGFAGFVFHNFSKKHEKFVFDISIFKDRNFTIASILMGLFGLGLYGGMVILPLLLEDLFHYPVLMAGLVMAPRGISSMISMLFVTNLVKKFDPRWVTLVGVLISSAGMYIGTYYNLDLSISFFIIPVLLQGFGLGMIFVPLSTIAFSTIAPNLRSEAAGLFSLLRTMGSAMGISIVATLLTRQSQVAWNHLGGAITPYNKEILHYLKAIHLSPNTPLGLGVLRKTVDIQAKMIAFVDVYVFITWSFLLMIPLLFLIKKRNSN